MNTAGPPRGWHPAYWALRCLAGLSERAVRSGTQATMTELKRLRTGRSVSRSTVVKMSALLRSCLDQMTAGVAARRDVPKVERDYRTALFALGAAIVAEYATGDPAQPPPRETSLSEDLRIVLGLEGKRRSAVLAALRGTYRSASVRRCAERIGVVETMRKGVAWWELPPPAGEPTFSSPVAVYEPPRTESARRAQDALSVFLGRRGGSATSSEAVDALALKGVSRAAVFRAARDMNLVRVTRGFGSSKTSVWSLPPAEVSEPDESGEVGDPVDFTHDFSSHDVEY